MGNQTPQGLYRFFDADGALLYVGLSVNVSRRIGNHRTRSFWFLQVATITITRYADAGALRAAETAAIHTENPRHNVAQAPAKKVKSNAYLSSPAYLVALASAADRSKYAADLRATGLTWREVGQRLGLTRQRAQQLGRRWIVAHPA